MKKLRIFLIMTVSLLLSMNTVVLAAGTLNVSFDGEKIQYRGMEDFAENFSDMYPGESRIQEILIQNNDNRDVEFYLQPSVLQSFEETVDASGAAYNISLKLHTKDAVYTLFGGTEEDDSARIGGDEQGLGNLNAAIEGWIFLTRLQPQETASLEMMVALDGESNTNAYQDALGTFQFEFGVDFPSPAPQAEPEIIPQYVKGDPEYVTRTVKGDDIVTRVVKRVKTGDTAPILAFSAAGIAALAILIVVGKKKGRKADEQ